MSAGVVRAEHNDGVRCCAAWLLMLAIGVLRTIVLAVPKVRRAVAGAALLLAAVTSTGAWAASSMCNDYNTNLYDATYSAGSGLVGSSAGTQKAGEVVTFSYTVKNGAKAWLTMNSAYVVYNSTTSGSGTYTMPAGNLDFGFGNSGTAGTVIFTFKCIPIPTLTSLDPASGSTLGGTVVTIKGTDFASGATVLVDGVAATNVVRNSSTSLSFTTPAHAEGPASVAVTNPGGTVATKASAFTYVVDVPKATTVTSLSPTMGPAAGGTSITATGTGFVPGSTSITIGGTAVDATSVTVNSDTSLTFTTPAHAAGNVSVTATVPGGSSDPVAGGFTYLAVPTSTNLTPTYGPPAGGTTVFVLGSGFLAGQTTVTIDGNSVAANVTSTSFLSFVTPSHAVGNVPVTVTTPGGTSSAVSGGFTYAGTPTATALSPASGAIGGGTSVTITGSNFVAGKTSVTIGGNAVAAGSVTVNNDTSLTFSTPAHAAGNVAVTVTNPAGTSSNVPGGFTYTAAPVASSFTASAVAYDISNTTFSLAGHATNSPTTWAVGSATTAQGGSVSVDSAGLVTYSTPDGFRGNDSFTFTATNPGGTSSPATVTVPVSNPTLLFTFPQGGGTRGVALSGVQIDTTGGKAPYSCDTVLNTGSLPAGTQLNSDCTITGTPQESKLFTFTAKVTDSSKGTGPYTMSTGPMVLTINKPTITLSPAAGALPGGSVGAAYTQSFTAAAGTSPYTYSAAGTLPPGLTLSGDTLSGTPTAIGSFTFTVTTTDGSTVQSGGPYTKTESYSIAVSQGSQTIEFAALADASLSDSPLTLTATASSGLTVGFASTTPGTCSVSGITLTLLAIGPCSITASQAGDGNWHAASDVVQGFQVKPAHLAVAAGSVSGAKVGASYSQSNTASGGIAPYNYEVFSGTLPAGLTLDPVTGTVSGTPASAGGFSYAVQATDSQPTPVKAGGDTVSGTIAKGDQTIEFASMAPSASVGGASYTVGASASSGLTVTYLLDASSTGCALSGTKITFTATGTCRINADQAGNSDWNPAPQAQQSFAIGEGGGITASASFSTGSLAVGATGTVTITFGNPNAMTSPNVSVVLTSPSLVSFVSGSAGGNCGVGSVSTATAITAGFDVAVPAGGCTVTLDYIGTTAGSASGFALGVSTPNGYAGTSVSGSGNFVVVPTITGISPDSGPVSQIVTITGTGFSSTPGNNTVTFGSAGEGTVTGASATSLTVAAPAIGSGAKSVTVTVDGQTTPAGVTYTFIDKPVAADKTGVAVPYASSGTAIDLSGSITGGPHTAIAIGNDPTHGTLSVAGDVVTYTPNATYFGADSFTYTAQGPGGTSAPATVSLTVATPAAPVAADKTGVAVAYDSAGTAIDLSGSITGVHTTIAFETNPAHGTATIAGDVITYKPASGYFGADSFTYTAQGPGGASPVATVSVTVATPAAPVAADKGEVAIAYGSSGTAIDLSASITGVHSAIVLGTGPAHGTATIAGDVVTYTPAANYYGADSFTYTAEGPGGTSAAATVSLTVATPGAPVAGGKTDVDVAYDSSSTAIDLSGAITGVHSAIEIGTPPQHGTVTITGDVVTYKPTSGYYGPDSFTYIANGPGGASPPATVTLTVATPPAPTAASGASTVAGRSTSADGRVAIDLSALVSGVFDSIEIRTQPEHGKVVLSGGGQAPLAKATAAVKPAVIATYTPAVGFAGADSFAFVAVGPGGTSAPATMAITVVGQVPTVQPKTAKTGDGQLVSVMLTDGAVGGPFTAAHVVSVSPEDSAATAIVASGSGDSATYRLDVTPNNRFGGTIVITYTLSNTFGASAPSTVTLTVDARPDPRTDPNVGAISDAQAEATRRFARAQVSNFMHRAEQLHNGGGRSGMAMGLTLGSTDRVILANPAAQDVELGSTAGMRLPGLHAANDTRATRNPDAVRAASGGAGQGGDEGKRPVGSLATWVGGAIDIGTRDATTDRSKISATTAGLSGGIDIKLGEGLLVGVGGGYGDDLSKIATTAQVRSHSSVYAAYASLQPGGNAFVDGMIGRGQLHFASRRLVEAVDSVATGKRGGDYTVAALSLGIDRTDGPLQWSLYGRGEYMDANLDAYVEDGADRYNLRFDPRAVESLTGTLGGTIQYRRKTGYGAFTPRLRAEWNHEFADVDSQWLDYADIPGAAIYELEGNGWQREQFQLTVGARFDILKGGWSIDLESGVRAAAGEKAATVQTKLSKQF